jgi:hypothetical protein
VVKQTGERRSDLAAGLSAATGTASSNIILVTYTGPNKKTVLAVVQYASTDSLDTLLGPQVAGATAATNTSEKALQEANQNLYDFTARTGLLFPDVDYKAQSQELSQLEVQLTFAKLQGDTKRIKGLTATIADRQKALVALASQVIQWQKLQEARSSAEAVNNKAHVDLNTANAAVASDHDPSAVGVRFAGHVSRVPEILRFAGVAAGVALLLSLGYIVFMEFLHPAVPSVASGWPQAIFPRLRTRSRVPAGVATRPRSVTKGAAAAKAADVTKAPEPPDTEAAARSNGEL